MNDKDKNKKKIKVKIRKLEKLETTKWRHYVGPDMNG
jgi:hypothetical protein